MSLTIANLAEHVACVQRALERLPTEVANDSSFSAEDKVVIEKFVGSIGKPSASALSELVRLLKAADRLASTRKLLSPESPKRGTKRSNPHPEPPAKKKARSFPNSINGWGIGKLIGSGAFGSVFEATPPNGLHRRDRDVAYVVKLVKVSPQTRKATDMLYHECLMYGTRLRDCDRVPRVPMSHAYKVDGFRYLAMERLGRSLDEMVDHGPFSDAKAASACAQLLEFFEFLHGKQIRYVDVKPENFLYGLGEDNDRVYCADFGLAEIEAGTARAKKKGPTVGTPMYLGIRSHDGFPRTYADDIESLVLVMIFLMKGSLPWSRAVLDDELREIKKATAPDELCAGLHPRWAKVLTAARGKPDNRGLRAMLA